MTIRTYIHSSHKRVESSTLLDCGATENFMSMDYAKWLHLPVKRLSAPRPLFNVDGTTNRKGDLLFYSDLRMRTGSITKVMRFFLTDLGHHRIILGYPWFVANQPRIDWAKGWIDASHLPVIISPPDLPTTRFPLKPSAHELRQTQSQNEPLLAVRVAYPTKRLTLTQAEWNTIPQHYRRHARVFSEEASQRFPEPRIWDHAIDLKPGAPNALPGKIYSLTAQEQDELKKFIIEHTRKGYIRPSKSPYAAPFFFIKKKDGKLRPVQDYRRLNQWTVRNTYPLPLIPQLINKARARALFTKFDIRWGYNNVRIRRGDEWKAAFITNEGLFEPTVMFFGLTNSPATFQMMMNAICQDEIHEGWLIVYMDDMLIATDDNIIYHRKCVHRVLTKLAYFDLFLKPERCVFEQKRIEFLGVILQHGTIHMDPAKTQGVADWPQPTTVTDVRSFLGFTGFYRYFIPNYSKIAKPLLLLTRKDTVWEWGEDQKRAFELLKTLMCRRPVLAQPNYNKPFVVHTNASAYGVGAILLQEGEIPPNVKTSKPLLHPIAYYSATFIQAERNYDIYERELLAVVKALKHWRHHLGGSRFPFTVVTDHANLAYWKEPRDLNRRTARWHSFLQDYWFNIQITPGKNHSAADFLSRHPHNNKGILDNTQIVVFPPDRFVDTNYEIADHHKGKVPFPHESTLRVADMDREFDDWDSDIAWTQRQYWKLLEEWQPKYLISPPTPGGHDRSWTKEGKLVVPPNQNLKRKLMNYVHDGYTAGHPGRDETIRKAKRFFWWPSMRFWIEDYVRGCATCQQGKILTHKTRVPMYKIPTDAKSLPFETTAMDLIVGLPPNGDVDSILTIVDHGCSRAALFLPCASTIMGPKIAQL